MKDTEDGRHAGSDSDAFYYDENGERVVLQRDARRFAVRFKPGRRSDDPTLTDKSRRFLRDESENVDFLAHYNLQIFERKDDDEAGFRRDVRTLNTEDAVEYATPVFRRSPHPMDVVFVTNRFIVAFNSEVGEDRARGVIDELNDRHGVRIVEQLDYAKPQAAYLLEAPDGDGPLGPVELAAQYYEESEALIQYAVPDLIQRRAKRAIGVQTRQDPASDNGMLRQRRSTWTYDQEQWHLAMAKVTDAWDAFSTFGSPDVTVAVADDGIDVGHPEYIGKVVSQYDFANEVADGSPKFVIDKHGTACAGVAVAPGIHARGAAPNCSLMAVRFPDMLGVADEARMFQWMADNGADVINCSWGPPDGTGAIYPLPPNVRSAIRYCVTSGRGGKGIPILWAAGNGDELVSNDGYAANPDVFAIGASTDGERRAYYSDFGPEILVCAPSSGSRNEGERRIFTTDRRGSDGYNPGGSTALGDPDGNYTNDFGGTSSSAPLAAGVVALMLSVNPDLRWNEVRDILKDTADKIGDGYDENGHSAFFGYGRINALKAVEAAQNRLGGDRPVQGPSITAPNTALRSGSPPSFQVDPGANPYYAVEVATRPELFNAAAHGAERGPDSFFATWQEPTSLLTGPSYVLSAAAWNRLKYAARLYFRVWTSESESAWVLPAASTPDAQAGNAPSIRLVPSVKGPESRSRSEGPPTFDVKPDPHPFYAVEVATRAELLNVPLHGAERNADNFFATWQNPESFFSGSAYSLPGAVWNRLKQADRLYYRVWASASDSAWIEHVASTPDDGYQSAPFVKITN